VSLQLAGDGWKEVAVAAALDRTVGKRHLPRQHFARS
jgi:hypothetical protein